MTIAPGGLRFGGDSGVIEWAVMMQRAPENATQHDAIYRNELYRSLIEQLAMKIASFHEHFTTGDRINQYDRLDAVVRKATEGFEQTMQDVGVTVQQWVYYHVRQLTEHDLPECVVVFTTLTTGSSLTLGQMGSV